jgi:hypothetical protein
MAYLGKTYHQEELPQDDAYDLIPSGWYDATIKEADIKESKSGGKYINIQFGITGPHHQGRVVFDLINFINKNVQTVEIAHKQLGSLIRALGLARVQDTDELIGGRCSIRIGTSKPSEEFPEIRNEVKGYRAIEGAKPAFQPPKQVTVAMDPQTNGSAKSTPPWLRK